MTVKATDCLSLTICFINRNLSGVEAESSKQIGGNISQINQRFSVAAGNGFLLQPKVKKDKGKISSCAVLLPDDQTPVLMHAATTVAP
jgi:hypothetical protein